MDDGGRVKVKRARRKKREILIFENRSQAKDAAIERLKELTISAPEGTKAMEIVRTLLQELTPEVREILPDEDNLRRRVSRWCRVEEVDVKVARGNFENYHVEEGLDNVPPPPNPTQTGDPTSSGGKVPEIMFLKGCGGENHRVRINENVYIWVQNLTTGGYMYRCLEARIGCKVTAKVYTHEGYFETRGTHDHSNSNSAVTPDQSRPLKKMGRTVKLVDEDGRDLGNVPISKICTAGEDSTQFKFEYEKLHRVDLDLHPIHISQDGTLGDNCRIDYDNANRDTFYDDGGDGGVTDDVSCSDNEEHVMEQTPLLAEISSKSKNWTKVTSSSKRRLNPAVRRNDDVKSGEKCFVCGDELLVAETLSCSADTFRKACCYLNIKSEKEWFPKAVDGKFYSFCESCTNEIMRIHNLYRKVEEIQSLIFRKVEHVEKRIADAEIVDNWMAEAPLTTAVRFEGFRKQVLINYRNKLKLRREIRTGKKLGHQLLEIQPISSAHMFAKDPAETEAFRRMEPLSPVHLSESSIPTKRVTPINRTRTDKRKRGRPNINKDDDDFVAADELDESILGLSNDNSVDFHFEDAEDDVGHEPAEIKFWEEDPSKLHVNVDNSKKDDEDNEDFYVSGDDAQLDDNSKDDNDPDYNEEDDDDDEDWGVRKTRSTTRKRRGRSSKISHAKSKTDCEMYVSIAKRVAIARAERAAIGKGKTVQKPPNLKNTKLKAETSSQPNQNKFPDSVLRKDGRIYLSGIEIIKNPPGVSKKRPYSITFSCGSCGQIARDFNKIRIHICGVHLGMYKCDVCEKQFSDPRTLKKHIDVEHFNKPVTVTPCPICERPMRSTGRILLFHIWSHLGEDEKKDPKYKDYCPPNKRDSNQVNPTHEKQKFMCSFCSKPFRHQGNLRKHELTHSGEGPIFQCQYCGKILKNNKRKWNHVNCCKQKELRNKDLYTYPCGKCPVRFNTLNSRSRHMKRFHRNAKDAALPFSCPKCPRCFSTRNAFKQHKRVCSETTGEGQVTFNDVEKSPQSRNSIEVNTNQEHTNQGLSSPVSDGLECNMFGNYGSLFHPHNNQQRFPE